MPLKVRILSEIWHRGVDYYEIQVETELCQWTTRKRYSDFVHLDHVLQAQDKIKRPELPSAGLCGLRHRLGITGFNERRRQQLDSYIVAVTGQVCSLGRCPDLCNFLQEGAELEGKAGVQEMSSNITGSPRLSPCMSPSPSPSWSRRGGSFASFDLGPSRSYELSKLSISELNMSLPPSPLPSPPWSRKVSDEALKSRESSRETSRCSSPAMSRWSTGSAATLKPVPPPLADFEPHFDADFASGLDFAKFEAQNDRLAALIRKAADLITHRVRFSNECEETWSGLRRCVLRLVKDSSAVEHLKEVPAKTVVWDFLALVAFRRPVYRKQVAEVGRALEALPSWADELRRHPDLRSLCQELWTLS